MSRLPLADAARVDSAKVRDYLLNPDNPQNNGKAGQFTRFGFTRADWTILATALRRHPVTNGVASSVVSPYGTKYVVQCRLETPDGAHPCLSTVWIVEPGMDEPRLVTAY